MATVMEAYDAPMLDYQNDGDVQMHPSHEPWFQDEAPMDDDHPEDKSQSHADYEDVEIEMENYIEDVQNPEYEMTDEGADYPVVDADEDVIVTDEQVNTAPNSSITPAADTGLSTSFVPTESSVHGETGLEPGSFVAGSDTVDTTASVLSSAVPTNEATHVETTQPSTSAEPHPIQAPAIERSLSTHSRSSTDADELAVVEATVHFGASPEHAEATRVDEGRGEPVEVSQNILDGAGDTAKAHDNDRDDAQPLDHTENTVEVAEAQSSQTSLATETEELLHRDGEPEPEDGVPVQAIESDPTSVGQAETASQAPEAASADDPYEISEGVFIEPPPGVLLSLLNVDHPDVCIFNQPNHPETSAAAATSQVYIVLLEDRPTLYYEPLSVLFDALRQNEFIANLYDLSQAELVLNAYDLQLTISEDNIFARETSLHDLQMLHDGSDIAGPLRLRLQSAIPRFIVRYRLLQDQILRLNMADEQYEGYGQSEDPQARQDFDEEKSATHQFQIPEAVNSEELTYTEGAQQEEETHPGPDEDPESDLQQENEIHGDDQIPGGTAEEAGTSAENANTEPTTDDHKPLDATEYATSEAEKPDDGTIHASAESLPVPQEQEADPSTDNHRSSYDEVDDNAAEYEDLDDHTPEHASHGGEELEDGSLDHSSPEDAEVADSHSLADTEGYAVVNEPEQNSQDGEEAIEYPDDWDDTFEEDDGFGEPTDGVDGHEKTSDMIPRMLSSSSKSSKRSFDDVDPEDTHEEQQASDGSPGSKRTRVQ
ncbi:proteophosphoglycan ppg4 [Moniliophthora roreri MCA 2997]|uniref:Proteophosphoglycan ppg4 n=2 Tax=Moniliophthora roreri TaxID=221103 RepID=V2WSE0_MONRO|nr:proteophosphoglycan ppg4 [Moniliophthora roreri MCA 2997]KAI3613597.1 proteophosphoglycan ppg4 [Moniliophthora roreri]